MPLATLLKLADRPGEIPGLGPVDPWLARDLARATVSNPKTTWCLTVTDQEGHAIGHGCARPEPKNHSQRKPGSSDGRDPPPPPRPPDPSGESSRDGPGFAFTATGQHGPPAGTDPGGSPPASPGNENLVIAIDPIATQTCDHRFEATGHDPGVKLRHLAEIRHATCTGPTPKTRLTLRLRAQYPVRGGWQACLCNGGPKCRHEHRLKQDPRWKVEQVTPATFRWTTPSGRQYTTEPTRYPV